MTKKINFIKARQKASELLLLQDNEINFPIDVKNLKIVDKNIKFASYNEYASKVGIDVRKVSDNGNFDDAMVVPIRNIYLILYNDEIKNSGRILWSLAHELGHIILNHKNQGVIEETEAHTFASQLLLPQCVLKELFRGGKKITTTYLKEKFGLSEKAAQSCLKLVGNKLENEYDALYDDIILQKCSNFIKNELSGIDSPYYEDEMNDIRNSWLYDK